MPAHFSALEGFRERHTHRELEAVAAALFLAHHDLAHYDACREDLRGGSGRPSSLRP